MSEDNNDLMKYSIPCVILSWLQIGCHIVPIWLLYGCISSID